MEKGYNIKFTQVSETYPDCTAKYEVTFDGNLPFDEFTRHIKDNLSNEWGKINIVGHKIKITYKNGVFECTESEIPLEELLNSEIESIKAHGGWSNMDYFIKLKR